MNKELLKKAGIYLAIIAFFLVLAYAWVPQVLQGKIVNQPDINSYMGMSHEASAWNAAHPDDKTFWTNSMFGGMPTVGFMSSSDGDLTAWIYRALLAGRRPATYLFIALLGAFLLMLSAGVDKFLAVAGAIAISFCAYNFQIIQVGHNTKMQAIAFMPWAIAAFILAYRSIGRDKWLLRTLAASALFAFAVSFQIKAGHPQITYYLAIILILYAVCLLVSLCVRKDRRALVGRFFAISAVLILFSLVGIGANANKLWPTYQYGKYTMRGGSELSSEVQGREINSKGLDINYATEWSYGIGETFNILIPDLNGGSSVGPLGEKSHTAGLLRKYGYKGRELRQTLSRMPLYWGPQPFTAGPMYMGAISVFLFLLGMLLYRGKEKWWLLAAVVVAMMLAWGNHCMWWTRLWFDYMPMYSKFRSVSMALVVLQVALPLLGFVILDRIMKGEYDKAVVRKKAVIAYAVTGGICLLLALIPSIAGTFESPYDQDVLADVLRQDRISLLRADALRSLLFITAAFIIVLLSRTAGTKSGSKAVSAIAFAMAALVILDLGIVGKRYLNASHFVTPKENKAQFEPRPVDRMILQDPDPDYRVLDISTNTFNDAIQSYHHKCIGGYSPVKMQRYQDLIDRYITPEMKSISSSLKNVSTIAQAQEALPDLPVLSALNCKYIILGGDNAPLVNTNALGNCWFVDKVRVASGADAEFAALRGLDFPNEAVIGDDFAVPAFAEGAADAGDSIALVEYAPNTLVYRYRTSRARLAVFSEVYYPDWRLTDDKGVEIPLLRADWLLRAAVIPEGEGLLTMRFDMEAVRTSEAVSRICSAILLVMLLLCGALIAAKPCLQRTCARRSQVQ
ncbi:MAG: hypothetical protein MJY62_02265 [Bacteroidales bacterium]|nr:hypothetical protein [Bacteroidales bacterium]